MELLTDGSPETAKYLIIYEAPHEDDILAGRCLTDGYGKSFWRIAKRAGIDKSECYIVPTIGAPCKRGDSDKSWNEYWDAHDAAVRRFSGRVIICLGGDAFHRATGLRGSHQDWAGYLVHPSERATLTRTRLVPDVYKSSNAKKGIRKGDPRLRKVKEDVFPFVPPTVKWIITTQDPGALWRSGLTSAPLVVSALEKAVRAEQNTLRESRTAFAHTAERITSSIFALDLEGIDSIERVGIASPESAWTAPWDANVREIIQEAVGNPNNLVIIHNANFDVPFLERAGIVFRARIFDTMIGSAFREPDQRKGLVACGSLWLDSMRWKPPRDGKPTGSQRLDMQSEATYNALDTIRELELYDVLRAGMEADGQLDLFLMMMKTLRTLIRMQQRGIALDPARQGQWINKLRESTAALSMKWAMVAPGVNFNSPVQVKKWFKSIGAVLPLNKKGGDSTDREALYMIRARQPELAERIDLLVEVRKAHKDLATYASIERAGDGRVHPSFALVSKDEDGLGKELAGTFRITAKDPNLQNQTGEAQGMYVPRPGWCFVVADYGSLEARLFAALTNDPVLQADLAADLHNINMQELHVDRVRAKNGFYGWEYGSGAKTLYNTFLKHGYKVSMKDCQDLLDKFERKYTIASAARQVWIAMAETNRYVENCFGYRRYFHEYDFPRTKVVNTKIQSTGAFMMWERLSILDDELMAVGALLLLMVHDSVVVECPIELRDVVARIIKDVMEAPFDNIAPGFSCPVEVKWSDKSWGELEKWNGL